MPSRVWNLKKLWRVSFFRKYYFGGIFCTPDDFEASHAFGTGPPTPLTDNILVDSICLLANSVSMYYSFKGDSSKPGGVTHLQGGATCSRFKEVQFLQSNLSQVRNICSYKVFQAYRFLLWWICIVIRNICSYEVFRAYSLRWRNIVMGLHSCLFQILLFGGGLWESEYWVSILWESCQ